MNVIIIKRESINGIQVVTFKTSTFFYKDRIYLILDSIKYMDQLTHFIGLV